MTRDASAAIALAEKVGAREYGPLTRNWSFNLDQLAAFYAAAIEQDRAEREAALIRADGIIGWMSKHIGQMCPPNGGLAALNEHFLFMSRTHPLPSPPSEETSS